MARERAWKRVAAEWADVVLVCRKCSKKLDGGFGADGDERLAKALRRALDGSSARGIKSRRRKVAVIEVGCLDVCPKGAVVLLRGERSGPLAAGAARRGAAAGRRAARPAVLLAGVNRLVAPRVAAVLTDLARPRRGDEEENMLKKHVIAGRGLLAFLALPVAADAQGIVGGAENGAARGRRAAGPVGGVVGGVVGGAVGGAVGGVRGVLGLPRRHRLPGHRPYHHRRYYR